MGQRQGSFLRNRPLLDDGVLVVAVLVVELLIIMFMMLVKVTTHFGWCLSPVTFFTSGFRLFPDIVVDSKILGKISVQTKRSFVCCEGLKILLLFFTKSKSFPFLQELIIYFVEGGGAVNCMMARLVNSLGKLKMSQGTSITPLTIWSGGWSFLHKVVQILAIFQTKKLTINLTSKSIHCSPIDFDSARA